MNIARVNATGIEELTMGPTKHQPMQTVHDWSEVPSFANEEEESAFWGTHEFGDEILERMAPPPEELLPPARSRDRRSSVSPSYADLL